MMPLSGSVRERRSIHDRVHGSTREMERFVTKMQRFSFSLSLSLSLSLCEVCCVFLQSVICPGATERRIMKTSRPILVTRLSNLGPRSAIFRPSQPTRRLRSFPQNPPPPKVLTLKSLQYVLRLARPANGERMKWTRSTALFALQMDRSAVRVEEKENIITSLQQSRERGRIGRDGATRRGDRGAKTTRPKTTTPSSSHSSLVLLSCLGPTITFCNVGAAALRCERKNE